MPQSQDHPSHLQSTSGYQQGGTSLSDICLRIKNGDEESFREFYTDTFMGLSRYLFFFIKRSDIYHDEMPVYVEDLLQETYVKFWANRKNISCSYSIKSLLYKIGRNTTIDLLRKRNKRISIDQEYALKLDAINSMEPLELDQKEQLASLLKAWVRELSPRCQEAFMLSRYDGLTVKEISDIMEISVNTVKSHIQKAATHLRERAGTNDKQSKGPGYAAL